MNGARPRIPTVLRRCADCGCALPTRWPRGLCGRCSLEGALRRDQDPSSQDGSPLSPGRILDNRFQLREVIAIGGMAEVWLADDAKLGKPVALKFLHPDLRFDPSALAELREETEHNRRLRHPNILRVFDFHISEAAGAYICMEYARGISLQRLRLDRAGGRFTWNFLRPLVIQLCGALEHAHRQQVIHRDLKPANLILGPQGVLRLVDFGVAAVVQDPTVRISVSVRRTGTLHYMSPQQLSGLTPQPTDDFYSLGATLYDLLSGQPPFSQGDTPLQIREMLPLSLSGRLRQVGVCRGVPAHVEALIMACLAKRPERRPHSADEIADWIRDLRWCGITRLRGWLNRMCATSRPEGQS